MNKILFVLLGICLVALGLFFWSRTLVAPRAGIETSPAAYVSPPATQPGGAGPTAKPGR